MVDINSLLYSQAELPEKAKPLAMAFVNKQPSPDTMCVPEGFIKGTLFGSLYMPFTAGGNIG